MFVNVCKKYVHFRGYTAHSVFYTGRGTNGPYMYLRMTENYIFDDLD